MASLINNVFYLTPSAGLSFTGLGCLWLLLQVSEAYLKILFFAVGILLFCAAFLIGKYGFDSLERIVDKEAKAKIEVERERTSRKITGHNQELQKIEAQKGLGQERFKQGILSEILKWP